jgi:dTDP-4-amino-4,6-dideoxygalactose transaminase
MWIGGTPTITLKRLNFHATQPLPFPLGKKCHLFYSARYALFHGLAALGLRSGDKLLVPAYCCGTEVDPILAKGIEIKWYKIEEDLSISIDHLQKEWEEGVKGLLVTHYLGFDYLTEEIMNFVNERKILLIEDCAHAFLSSTESDIPLGAIGDAAIFSLRKSLPIPDGGALMLKNIDLNGGSFKLEPPNPFSVLFRSFELFGKNSTPSGRYKARILSHYTRCVGKAARNFRFFLRVFYKLFNFGESCLVNPNSYDFDTKASNWNMSAFSRRLLQFQDWKDIVKRRRENFTYLLEKLQGIDGVKPLMSSVPDGICPLFFPLLVKNREKLHDFLLKHGVDSHPWWGYFHPKVPWGSFPNAVRLKKEILGLPIHQDLNPEHMNKIIKTINLAPHNH